MTNSPPLSKQAQKHFGERFPGPGQLFRSGFLDALPLSVIECELEAQYQLLCERLGREPDYIDGHHHIHQYPRIADVISAFSVERRRKGQELYVRTTSDSYAAIAGRGVTAGKALLLSFLGAGPKRQLERSNIQSNTSFSGAYDFSRSHDYARFFRRMLKWQRENGLIMCHPGKVDALLEARDPITGPRYDEYRYFCSAEFADDLAMSNVEVSRFTFRD
jgi:hypothetical protein